jgi:hypothetical protein
MDKIAERVFAYKRTFEADCAKKVLEDLARFCRYDAPNIVVCKDGHTDVPATFLAEGRREVYLRIVAHMNAELKDEKGAVEDERNDSWGAC